MRSVDSSLNARCGCYSVRFEPGRRAPIEFSHGQTKSGGLSKLNRPESTTTRESDLGLETPETLLNRLTPNPRPFVWNVVDCAAMHVAVRPTYRCERAKIGDQVLIHVGRRRIEATLSGA